MFRRSISTEHHCHGIMCLCLKVGVAQLSNSCAARSYILGFGEGVISLSGPTYLASRLRFWSIFGLLGN